MAGSAHADAIGDVANAVTSVFSKSVNTDVTVGSFTNGSDVNAKANGSGSKAMAGGVVATGGGGNGLVNTKVTVGVFDRSKVKAKAEALDGAEAYAGGVVSASKDK